VSLWRFITGSVRIRVGGRLAERFINLAAAQGLTIWGLRRHRGHLDCSLTPRGFLSLRPVARATHCRVRILQKQGLPFLLLRLRRRRLLAAGALLFILALYSLTSFVWAVDIQGSASVPEHAVRLIASEEGLRPGAYKGSLDLAAVKRRLVLELDPVAWAEIELRGTRALVRVVERVTLPPVTASSARGGDIVARKAGRIITLLVLAGEAAAVEGDMVVPGQVLIRGLTQGPTGAPGSESEPEETAVPAVPARGAVTGRVWYQAYAEVHCRRTVAEPTGRTFTRTLLTIGEQQIILAGHDPIPFSSCEKEVTVRPVALWRNIGLPVEIITEIYQETTTRTERFSPQEALAAAQRQAEDRVRRAVPREAEVVDRRVEVVHEGPDRAGVRVVWQTHEEIGLFLPWNPPPGAGAADR